MFDFATEAPYNVKRFTINSNVAAVVLTKGKKKRVVPQPRALFHRTDDSITIQSARKGETFNFPRGEWSIDHLRYND